MNLRVSEVVLGVLGGWETQGGGLARSKFVLFLICDLHTRSPKIITKGEQDMEDVENQDYTGDEHK
ncbi:hypothetical protein Taro_032500 [Colocasia esculenta]|uniref:Uncharacterized protein n=1 Tax=Colocasia esculenta TaxID=4460 RepID=A0A843VXH2_COLES|nr:hypothetical protein [Colocasia esculenta]